MAGTVIDGLRGDSRTLASLDLLVHARRGAECPPGPRRRRRAGAISVGEVEVRRGTWCWATTRPCGGTEDETVRCWTAWRRFSGAKRRWNDDREGESPSTTSTTTRTAAIREGRESRLTFSSVATTRRTNAAFEARAGLRILLEHSAKIRCAVAPGRMQPAQPKRDSEATARRSLSVASTRARRTLAGSSRPGHFSASRACSGVGARRKGLARDPAHAPSRCGRPRWPRSRRSSGARTRRSGRLPGIEEAVGRSIQLVRAELGRASEIPGLLPRPAEARP